MPDALEPVEVGHQELAAPERAVGAVAEPVEREPEHRFGAAVLHHARGDVRVVVLHRDRREVEVEGELRRQVLRMEIVRDDLGPHAVQRGEMVDRLHERLVGREVLEVADVMAGDDVVAARDRDRRLQLRADREHGALRPGTAAACGSGAYPRDRRSSCSRVPVGALDGVVAADVDLAGRG